MTQKKKFNGTKVTTPFGRAGFSAIQKPSTKFNPDGEFNAKVILDDGPETEAFIEQLNKLYEAAYEFNRAEQQAIQDTKAAAAGKTAAAVKLKRADKPFKRVVDQDTGEELPQWSVNARMKAVRRGPQVNNPDGTKSPGPILGHNAVAVLDSRMKPVNTPIGSGSVIRFQAMAFPFYTAALGSGLQLKLIGVQVKELIAYTGGFKPDFDAVEGGFEETAPAPASQPPEAARGTPAPIETTSEDSAEWV